MNTETTNYKTFKQISLYTTQFAATKNTNYHRNLDNAAKKKIVRTERKKYNNIETVLHVNLIFINYLKHERN